MLIAWYRRRQEAFNQELITSLRNIGGPATPSEVMKEVLGRTGKLLPFAKAYNRLIRLAEKGWIISGRAWIKDVNRVVYSLPAESYPGA